MAVPVRISRTWVAVRVVSTLQTSEAIAAMFGFAADVPLKVSGWPSIRIASESVGAMRTRLDDVAEKFE